MTTLRRFTCDDLFTFNPVNLDFFTETVHSFCMARHDAVLLQILKCPNAAHFLKNLLSFPNGLHAVALPRVHEAMCGGAAAVLC